MCFTRPGFFIFFFFWFFFFIQKRPQNNFFLAWFSPDEFIIRTSIQSRKLMLTKFFQILFFRSLRNFNPDTNPSTHCIIYIIYLNVFRAVSWILFSSTRVSKQCREDVQYLFLKTSPCSERVVCTFVFTAPLHRLNTSPLKKRWK